MQVAALHDQAIAVFLTQHAGPVIVALVVDRILGKTSEHVEPGGGGNGGMSGAAPPDENGDQDDGASGSAEPQPQTPSLLNFTLGGVGIQHESHHGLSVFQCFGKPLIVSQRRHHAVVLLDEFRVIL